MTDDIEITYETQDHGNGEMLRGVRGKVFVNLEAETITIGETEQSEHRPDMLVMSFDQMRRLTGAFLDVEKLIAKGE